MRSSLDRMSVSVLLCGAVIVALPFISNGQWVPGNWHSTPANRPMGVLVSTNNFDSEMAGNDADLAHGTSFDAQKLHYTGEVRPKRKVMEADRDRATDEILVQ